MQYNKPYSHIRGFNIHGDWGSNGLLEWLNFDPIRYQMMVQMGQRQFPGMNTVRIWLSMDAYMADKNRYLAAVRKAGQILTEAGLWIIPTYFNGWFGTPCFGAFVCEALRPEHMPVFKSFIQESVKALADAKVLIHDVSNEPYNVVNGCQKSFDTVTDFLVDMIQAVREVDDRKVTVGTQSYPAPDNRQMCDIDRLAPFVDVITLHPYNMDGVSLEEFDKQFKAVVDYVEEFQKPYIITESMWGAATAEGRKFYLDTEFPTYAKYDVGFLCHALFTCPVADLYPVDYYGCSDGMYMAFLDEEFRIRPYHDIFNDYA